MNILSKASNSFRYVYLAAFFALLAGFFSPFISGDSFVSVIFGVLVLFMGLAGGVLVYKSTNSETRQTIYFAGGIALIFFSLFLIFQMTGRV